MAKVNPQVEALINAGRAAGSLPFEAMTVDMARAVHAGRRELHQLVAEDVSLRRDFTVSGPVEPVPLRLYRPAGVSADAVLPCFVFMHGGGWMLGSLDSHDGLCCHLANRAQCCVISIDYRLAPESPFPAALDDCIAAYSAITAQAAALHIDPARIAVGGDSAGGTLAATLALLGRDGVLPAPIQQTLIYPVVDMNKDQHDYPLDSSGMFITGATMVYFRDHYVKKIPDRVDWRTSPLKVLSLEGVAPAVVITCGHDPLRDEGRAYADRLEQEGVAVKFLHLSDLPHGVLTMTKVVRAAIDLQDFVAAALRDAFTAVAISLSDDRPAVQDRVTRHNQQEALKS